MPARASTRKRASSHGCPSAELLRRCLCKHQAHASDPELPRFVPCALISVRIDGDAQPGRAVISRHGSCSRSCDDGHLEWQTRPVGLLSTLPGRVAPTAGVVRIDLSGSGGSGGNLCVPTHRNRVRADSARGVSEKREAPGYQFASPQVLNGRDTRHCHRPDSLCKLVVEWTAVLETAQVIRPRNLSPRARGIARQ